MSGSRSNPFLRSVVEWGKNVATGFLRNNCAMHAAGLTYYSLLSLVPVLCCILVVAKLCNVDEHARTWINTRIDSAIADVEKGQDEALPLITPSDEKDRDRKAIAACEFAGKAREISNALFERIDNFDIATFGKIGFVFLLWTVISSLTSVEASFNRIFGIDRQRPVWKRSYLYLLIMVVLPILVAVAMSLPLLHTVKSVIVAVFGSTYLTKWVSDGLISLIDSRPIGVVFTVAMASLNFAFIFWAIPNKKVDFRAACRGGSMTAVLFCAWLKICAVAQVGIAKSSALYGSFAFFPIVLTWLYMSWQIVLLGANMVRAFEISGEKP